MSIESSHRELPTIVFAIFIILLLMATTFVIFKPFIPPLVWAATIVISSWPIFLKVEQRLGNRRSLAVLTMILTQVFVLILPIMIALIAITENISFITETTQTLSQNGLPPPPAWVADVPLIGQKVSARWLEVTMTSKEEIIARVSPFIGNVVSWLILQIGGLSIVVVHLVVTVIISALLYANGETAAKAVQSFAKRLAQNHGENVVILAGQAVRAVTAGVVITAVIQAVLSTVGLLLTGVPYALMLGSIVFLMSLIQIGAGPVLIGSICWLFYKDHAVAGWVLIVLSLFVLLSDNFIRPILIKRGADLPLILIFAGVIGGLIAFGVVGLFVGPVVLAVSYTLIGAWIRSNHYEA